MIQRRNVYEKVSKECSGFILVHHPTDEKTNLLRLKDSPEEMHLLYSATRKFYELVALHETEE